MRGRRARGVVLAAALAGAVVVPAADAAPQRSPRTTVVVAVADAGINPYHRAFYRPDRTAHPCTYVAGFTDCSVPALPLTVGGYDYRRAVRQDAALWAKVKPGQWYWIPRTSIIGAVCDPSAGAPPPEPPQATQYPRLPAEDTTCIRDDGTGSGVASSVVAEARDALLLVHDGDAEARLLETAPVVPDLQVHRWSPPAPAPSPADEQLCPKPLRRAQTLFFLGAGDGAPLPALSGCGRSGLDVQVVGGAYPGYWKYDSGSAYDFASWHCRPIVTAGKATASDELGCGTNVAAATAAGAAAAALQALREHDGSTARSTATHVSRRVSTEQFLQALRDGASYAPDVAYDPQAGLGCSYVTCFVGWVPLPAQGAHVAWGYGWLDGTVAPAVVSCALGKDCPAKPAGAAEYHEARRAARAAGGAS